MTNEEIQEEEKKKKKVLEKTKCMEYYMCLDRYTEKGKKVNLEKGKRIEK